MKSLSERPSENLGGPGRASEWVVREGIEGRSLKKDGRDFRILLFFAS